MKNKFSRKWKSSSQPRKQRKYMHNAPLHIKSKAMNVHISKDLRKKHGKRSVRLRKGDIVMIVRGGFKGKQGKVLGIMPKKSQVEVEGIQRKKQDGSKVNVRLQSSNLQIIEINFDDAKRDKSLRGSPKEEKQETKPEKSKPKKTEIKHAP